jgi:hypothetical protein
VNTEADFVRLQSDLYEALLSEPLLSTINVVLYRKLRLESVINLDAIYLTPRNGKAGCGILVEMPSLRVLHPGVSGPPGSLEISCAILEEPNLNFAVPAGSFQSAESVSRLVLDSSHLWSDAGIGVMSASREAIQPVEDFGPGLVAYRVRWALQETKTQIPRAAAPAASVDPDTQLLTVSCGTAGAQICYTLDHSFPGPGNPLALFYAAPVPAPPAGTLLRAAAYAPNMFRSSTIAQQF